MSSVGSSAAWAGKTAWCVSERHQDQPLRHDPNQRRKRKMADTDLKLQRCRRGRSAAPLALFSPTPRTQGCGLVYRDGSPPPRPRNLNSGNAGKNGKAQPSRGAERERGKNSMAQVTDCAHRCISLVRLRAQTQSWAFRSLSSCFDPLKS